MSKTIPNLWPEDLSVDVQTPVAILRVQADQLSRVTRGILTGTVETESGEHCVQHRLVVIAPAYNGYRHTLVTALHDRDLPYPVEIRAEALARRPFGPDSETDYPAAADDTELQRLLQQALDSGPTRAIIFSLIAKSNETNPSPQISPLPDIGDATTTAQDSHATDV